MSSNSSDRFRVSHYQLQFLLLHIHDTRTNLQWLVEFQNAKELTSYVFDLYDCQSTRAPDFLVSHIPGSPRD